MNVWRAFKRACEAADKQAVCYTKFIKLWEQFHPEVVVAKPMTDLCLTCQQNTSKLLRSANLPDREKSECVLAQQEHLNCVQTERDFYRNACTESKNNLEELEDTIELDEQHDACSLFTSIHYSFDFAQQIHIPSNPMQPGPIYFKTPRKCGTFGIMCEAIPRQVNYLIETYHVTANLLIHRRYRSSVDSKISLDQPPLQKNFTLENYILQSLL